MQLRLSAVDTRSCLVCTIISLDRFRIKERNHMMKILQGSNQREKETLIPSVLALLFLASYSTNRNAVVFPLFTVHSLAWWAHTLLPSEGNLLHAMNRLQPFLRAFHCRNLHLLCRYSIGAKPTFARVCVTGAQLALFIITLSTSLYFWCISGSLLWPDFST